MEKLEPCALLVGCEMVQPLWKTAWWFLKILNIDLPYDPAIQLLGIQPEQLQAGAQILVHQCS